MGPRDGEGVREEGRAGEDHLHGRGQGVVSETPADLDRSATQIPLVSLLEKRLSFRGT